MKSFKSSKRVKRNSSILSFNCLNVVLIYRNIGYHILPDIYIHEWNYKEMDLNKGLEKIIEMRKYTSTDKLNFQAINFHTKVLGFLFGFHF